jgi:hypothetical protein
MPRSSDAKDDGEQAAAVASAESQPEHFAEEEEPARPSRRRLRHCPHCHGDLIEHDEAGPKAGAYHCNTCGCCLDEHGEVREGHTPCVPVVQAEAREAEEAAKA